MSVTIIIGIIFQLLELLELLLRNFLLILFSLMIPTGLLVVLSMPNLSVPGRLSYSFLLEDHLSFLFPTYRI